MAGTCAAWCYDDFSAPITLGAQWTRQTLPWKMLRQAGWGTPATLDGSQLKFLEFWFDAGATFDLYVD